jgi:AcrR family transcriptional regulator
MTEEQKKDAKERIMDASLSLFARKGYSGVGVREIAKDATVNVSMISYYFGGKAGILKAIVKEAFEKYYQAISAAADEDTPVEEHFRLIVHAIVKYFRENAELGIVAFDVIPLDIPEILDYKVETALTMHEGMKPFHDKLGLDRTDPVQLSIFPRALIATVLMHFQALYAAQEMPLFKEQVDKMDDIFYERYAETIADLFLYGMDAVFNPEKKTKGEKNA